MTFFLYDPFISLVSTATYVFIAFCPLCFAIHMVLCCRWARAELKAVKAKRAEPQASGSGTLSTGALSTGSQAGAIVPFRFFRWHPAAWSTFSALPFPGLDRLLVAFVLHDRNRGKQAIDRLKHGWRTHRVAAMLAEVRLCVVQLEAEHDLSELGKIAQALPVGEGKYGWQPRLARAKIGRISDQHDVLKWLFAVNEDRTKETRIDPKPCQQKVLGLIEEFQQAARDFTSPLAELFQEAGERWQGMAMNEISLRRNGEEDS